MIGVLKEDGAIRFAIDRAVVALLDQHMGLALFAHLAIDELHDVGMVGIQDDHLGGAPGFSSALDHSGKSIEALHETHWARGNTTAGERFMAPAQCREIRACARAPLEE